jgi:mannose-6-phosphate isomerase-like protein (cupin superfamily)
VIKSNSGRLYEEYSMTRLIFVLFLFSSSIATAQEHWSADDLAEFTELLSGRVEANNAAILDRIIDHGNYFASIVHREPGPGFSESHRDWADLYFVTSGSASLTTGGTIAGGAETDPGEVRGSTINGGQTEQIAAGDVVHIPAGVPHHVIVNPGEEVTYFIFKIQALAE